MLRVLECLPFLCIWLYFVYKSKSGNRSEEEDWPTWAKRLGDRNIPHIVSSNWFGEIAWAARRILPIVFATTVISLWAFVSSGHSRYLLPFPDWLGISSLLYGSFVAYAPFAAKPRRNPLDKWTSVIMALVFVFAGLVIAVIALIVRYATPSISNHSAWWHIAAWATRTSIDGSLGIAGGLIGFGITMIGLAEILPSWRTNKNIIDDSGELEELRIKNEKLEAEVQKLRRRLHSYDRQRRRRQPTRR